MISTATSVSFRAASYSTVGVPPCGGPAFDDGADFDDDGGVDGDAGVDTGVDVGVDGGARARRSTSGNIAGYFRGLSSAQSSRSSLRSFGSNSRRPSSSLSRAAWMPASNM